MHTHAGIKQKPPWLKLASFMLTPRTSHRCSACPRASNVPFPHARRCSIASVVAFLIEFAAGRDSCAFMEGQGLALSSFQRAPCSLSIEIKALAQLVSHARSHPGGPGFKAQAPQFLPSFPFLLHSHLGRILIWAAAP